MGAQQHDPQQREEERPLARDLAWNELLLDQIDWHWTRQAGPRLDGLSDEEYLWEPVVDCWSPVSYTHLDGYKRQAPWGGWYGQVFDRFGVMWAFSCD